MRRLELQREAVEEIAEAASWYAEQRLGLDRELLDEIERILADVESGPRAFPPVENISGDLDLRRALLRRFPYSILFLVMQEEIRVVALAHSRRRPGYWTGRLAEG
ncbi:MAG: type II toxin-antitoxin system RelE/ParE family toxin [Acidobacteriota bacterium]